MTWGRCLCDPNPRFMARKCAKSCQLCAGSDGHKALYPDGGGASASEPTSEKKRQKSTMWGILSGQGKHMDGRVE